MKRSLVRSPGAYHTKCRNASYIVRDVRSVTKRERNGEKVSFK